MNVVEQFKRRILDLAIRGKLVPQDPNDEPASVLLERIKAEKAKLVKAGKIKKEKNPSEIVIGSDGAAYEKFGDGSTKDISNELPFALPNGWVWTRIGNVCYDFQYGTARKSTKNGNVPVLRMGNLRAGEIDYSDLVYTSDKDDIERYCLNPGDLLFNRTNSSEKVGKVSIFRGKKPCIYAGYLVRFRPVRSDSEFINYMMNSRYQWEFCQSVKTDAVNQSNISASKFIQFLVPLPPLAEQKRIVAKIKELFMVADLLDATTNYLMNTSKQIDKKILDLAIRGKLVPQDPNDEPARELVKRIAASHKSPSKNQSEPIYPPFEIPDTWEWVRLGEVSDIVRGTGIKRNETTSAGVKCVRYGEIYTHYEESFARTFSFVPKTVADRCHDAKCGDVLCTLTGENEVEIAKAIAYTGKERLVIGGDLARISNHPYDPMLLVYFMFSPFMISQKASVCTGGMIVHMGKSALSNLYIPLPPLAEQKRIVAKIEELRMVIKSLTT